MSTEEIFMAAVERFSSIDELVREHTRLLKQYLSKEAADAVPKAKDFVARAVQTGSILSEIADRDAAQVRINYWSTTLLQGFGMYFEDTLLAGAVEHEIATIRARAIRALSRIDESPRSEERMA